MVVNAGLAEQLWGASDAIGQCVVVGGQPCVEVVGVSEDRRHVSVTGVHDEWFVPFSQASSYIGDAAPPTLLVRARRTGRDAVGPVAHETGGSSTLLGHDCLGRRAACAPALTASVPLQVYDRGA